MINHRSPEFRELIARVTKRLQHGFGTANDVLILTSSGTGALEAAIVNHLSPGDHVLGVTIGAFGDRFAEIAERYGADVRRLEVEWGRAARGDDVASALREMRTAGRSPAAVLLTHNETSTGVVNPLPELAAAIHENAPDALVIVDAISGLGAVPFETDGWGLDVVATGSQKSWMVPPGLAMVSVSERAWAASARATMPRFYFDLAEARRFETKGETPWTPAVGVLFALDVALEMIEAEGYAHVFERHAACGRAARAGLSALGFTLLAEAGYASDTVTAAWLPEGLVWVDLNRELRSRGLVLAGGQGRLSGRILRVGHLGDVEVSQIADAMEILEEGLRALGVAVEDGVGRRAVEAASEQVPTRA
jgi:aspartate aminotransferase-like enzyme